MKRVLAIGGSDSGGGAGIQADLKALHALGVHGSTVITAVTAQSSTAVTDVHVVPLESIRRQLRAVLDDIGADVTKTGMLPTAQVVELVAQIVSGPLVVDPVGASTTGTALQDPAARAALRELLLPRATVITPNLAEVEGLVGRHADLEDAAKALHALGPQWVLITGGHRDGPPTDLLYDGSEVTLLEGPRVTTLHTHGTGCTLASAIAGRLALGDDVPTAVATAKALVTDAIRAGYSLGSGAGPVRA